MKYEYRETPEGINNPPTNHLTEAMALAGGLLVLVVGAFFLLGWAADRLVDRLSPETEQRLAAMISIPVDSSRQAPDAQELQKLLDLLVLRAPAVRGPLRLRIVCSPQVNAVALPGGTVLLFSGLVSRMRSENEMAMVLGHEVGHFAARDHLKGLGRMLVLMALTTSLFGSQQEMPASFQNLVGLASFRFSHAQEEAADRVGARLVNDLYGHAGGVADFFRTMDAEEHQSEASAWFSTHPASSTRVESLAKIVAQEGWTLQPVKTFDGREWAERCR